MNNVIQINNSPAKTLSEQWVDLVSVEILKGNDIDLNDLWTVIDWSQNNTVARDLLLKNKLISKQEWARRERIAQKQMAIEALLGFFPTDAHDFVMKHIKHKGIDIDDIGMIYEANPAVIVNGVDMRRFVEIEWSVRSSENGWAATKGVDWTRMWQSVNEHGEDPTLPFLDAIREQQEENRQRTPIELWVTENKADIFRTGNRPAESLFNEYREWEDINYPTWKTNVQMFGNAIGAMITHQPELGLRKKRNSKGNVYHLETQPE